MYVFTGSRMCLISSVAAAPAERARRAPHICAEAPPTSLAGRRSDARLSHDSSRCPPGRSPDVAPLHPGYGPASAHREIGLVRFLEELFLGHLLLGDVGQFDNEVDHLLLVDRRPHGSECVGVLLVVV